MEQTAKNVMYTVMYVKSLHVDHNTPFLARFNISAQKQKTWVTNSGYEYIHRK
jgi:hypothetical protein